MSKRNNGLTIYASAGADACNDETSGSNGTDVQVAFHMENCDGCYITQPVINVTNHVNITNTTHTNVHHEVTEARETHNPSLGEVASFASTLIGLLGSL